MMVKLRLECDGPKMKVVIEAEAVVGNDITINSGEGTASEERQKIGVTTERLLKRVVDVALSPGKE